MEREQPVAATIEAALFANPARNVEDAAFKMRVVARHLRDGSDLDHVASLMDRLRHDRREFANAALA